MIENTVILGMGALGLMFGEQIREHAGDEHLCFLMDEDRRARHAKDRYLINGREVSFCVVTPEEIRIPADLIIVATKYSGLLEAAKLLKPAFGPETILVSLLNGISSEEILAESYPREQILDCVAIGMDAVREGTALTYQHMGRWQIGSSIGGQEARIGELRIFLDRCGIECEVSADIRKTMWNKFMINVGINQTCMVYETGYGGALKEGKAREDLIGAMKEVIELAGAEGIRLTEEDLEKNLDILSGLNPLGIPSMRQDALAGRISESELFSGTMVRLAKKHGISVPVNERYLRRIQEMEKDLPRQEKTVCRPFEGGAL